MLVPDPGEERGLTWMARSVFWVSLGQVSVGFGPTLARLRPTCWLCSTTLGLGAAKFGAASTQLLLGSLTQGWHRPKFGAASTPHMGGWAGFEFDHVWIGVNQLWVGFPARVLSARRCGMASTTAGFGSTMLVLHWGAYWLGLSISALGSA